MGGPEEAKRTRRAARVLLTAALAGLAVVLLALDPPWRVPGGPAFFAREGDALVPIVKRALWWSVLASAGLCGVLLATVRVWTAPVEGARPPAPATPRWLGPGLLAALLVGTLVRAELATSGLWWDEAWVVRRAVVGEFEPEPSLDGPVPRFEPVPWVRTLFAYEKPTNHLPQSFAARVSVDAWRAATGAEPWAFDELALRLPSVLAALLSIPLLGLLVAEWGFPRAGVAAAFLLALHPWHVEDATAARGYAFVAFASIAGAFCLVRALRIAAWRYWLAFGATQVLLLWTHPFAVYLTACFGAAVLVELLLGRRPREAARLVAVSVAAAALFLVLMGPGVAQVPLWHAVHTSHEGDTRSRWSMAAKIGRALWLRAAVGLPGSSPQTDPDRSYYDFGALRKRSAAARPLAFLALPTVALLGLGALLRRGGPERAVVAALALSPFAALGGSALLDQLGRRFHARYLFFVLALVPPLLCVGLEALAARLAGRRRGAAAAALALGVAGFAWAVLPATWNYVEHPFSGMRDATAFLSARPDAADALRAGIGVGGDTARIYDPGLLHVETGDELRDLWERAQADGRPLYVLYGHQGRNRFRHGDVFALLDDPRLFEPLGRFDAIAPEFVYRVLRYTGPPAAVGP